METLSLPLWKFPSGEFILNNHGVRVQTPMHGEISCTVADWNELESPVTGADS